MKKENAVIFGVTGVVVAAVLIGGGIYMKTERDRNLNACLLYTSQVLPEKEKHLIFCAV